MVSNGYLRGFALLLSAALLAGCGSTGSLPVDATADLHNADITTDTATETQVPDRVDSRVDGVAPDEMYIPETVQCIEDADCAFLDNSTACLVGRCSSDFVCSQEPATDGTFCLTPDEPCFESGLCTAGDCQPELAVDCNDDDPCTEDSCGAEGCRHDPLEGESCDDEDACTVDDVCGPDGCQGTPIVCNDGNQCTQDSCDQNAGCVFQEMAGDCDDGDPCTTDDTCLDGVCTGTPGGCTPATLACHIASLGLESPGFCDLTPSLDCQTSTTLVQQMLASQEDSFVSMLLVLNPLDVSAESQPVQLGQAECNDDNTACHIVGTAAALDAQWQAEAVCPDYAGCFQGTASTAELVWFGLAIPVYDLTIGGSLESITAPAGIVQGYANAFLRQNTAQALSVSFPGLAEPTTLADILDPNQLTTQNGNTGWLVDVQFECSRVTWNPPE